MNDHNTVRPLEANALLLLDELATGEPISQREIAGRLGIALGLVNSYLKTLVHKGYVQVKTCPRNRYAYLLTPTGMTEKSRHIYQQVIEYHQIFRHTRQDCSRFFHHLHTQGVCEVSFCGVDEFTEIAYLSLREARIELCAVFDHRRVGERFIDHVVAPLSDVADAVEKFFVVTSLREADYFQGELRKFGVCADRIYLPLSDKPWR